jgi:hypothetical protein
MCPFCLASMGLIVAGATSAGGLTALAVKLSLKRNNVKEVTLNTNDRKSRVASEPLAATENA